MGDTEVRSWPLLQPQFPGKQVRELHYLTKTGSLDTVCEVPSEEKGRTMTLDHIPPVRNETSADVGPCCLDALYSKCQQDIEVKIASLEVEERRVGRQGVAGATEGWELPSSRLELHFTVRLGIVTA